MHSIHNAIAVGFNKIIFVIRKNIEVDFRERIGNRIEKICGEKDIEIAYAFQNLNDVPSTVPEGRVKPWGTGQAVLAAKENIREPFIVINADDYYGKEAFVKMHDWLCESHAANAYSMAGFILKNTLSENGGVTKGICKVKEGHSHIEDVVETSNIVKTEAGAAVDGVEIDPESYVSMNMWGLPAAFMDVLEAGFTEFFEKDVVENPLKAEYLLPTIIGGMLRKGECAYEFLRFRIKGLVSHTRKIRKLSLRVFGI